MMWAIVGLLVILCFLVYGASDALEAVGLELRTIRGVVEGLPRKMRNEPYFPEPTKETPELKELRELAEEKADKAQQVSINAEVENRWGGWHKATLIEWRTGKGSYLGLEIECVLSSGDRTYRLRGHHLPSEIHFAGLFKAGVEVEHVVVRSRGICYFRQAAGSEIRTFKLIKEGSPSSNQSCVE
jgi:hypothetical protein